MSDRPPPPGKPTIFTCQHSFTFTSTYLARSWSHYHVFRSKILLIVPLLFFSTPAPFLQSSLTKNSTNTNNNPSLSNHICLGTQISVSTTRPHHQKITADLPVHAVTPPLATVVPLPVIVSASQPRSCLSLKMALPGYCNHSFNLLKSESTLIQWVCSMCHSGPHWYIFECKYCKLKTCRPCTNKV